MKFTEHRGACQVIDGERFPQIFLHVLDNPKNGRGDDIVHYSSLYVEVSYQLMFHASVYE
ncbi:hypothetical protein Mth01_00700 [Sphaerimonospora thailandensis]|uniref:Uncharacterized protein n=1 Tax=Sphaerimonospora thailandensis TaxID=795644 RepID=A0A8J3VWX9_9ACTN|nr:hypothetical protein Mth01_00700 [Sphaerimonospora thailandensis]